MVLWGMGKNVWGLHVWFLRGLIRHKQKTAPGYPMYHYCLPFKDFLEMISGIELFTTPSTGSDSLSSEEQTVCLVLHDDRRHQISISTYGCKQGGVLHGKFV